MARLRRVVAYVGSTATTVATPVTQVSTPDDNFPKILKSVHVTPATPLVEVIISGAGYQFEDFDASRSAAGNWPIHCDEMFPALIQFAYKLINGSSGTIFPAITFEYEPQGNVGGVSHSPLGQ